MAGNSISYEGRAVNTERMPIEFGKAKTGTPLLKLTVAEQHRSKNKNAPQKYQDKNKTAEDWVDTTTSWHRITIFGDKALDLAADEEFGHGAILVIEGASYTEEDPWTDRAGVVRAGRPETIFDTDNGGTVVVKEYNGRIFGQKDPKRAIWDGDDDTIPVLESRGGGTPDFQVADDEGF